MNITVKRNTMWYHIKNNKLLITLITIVVFIFATETQLNPPTNNIETTATTVEAVETVENIAEATTESEWEEEPEPLEPVQQPEPVEETVPETSTEETQPASKGWDELITQLVKAPETNEDTYNRDLFKHWVDANKNGCNTRHEVLKAESLTPTTTQNRCTVIEGTWYSPFDDQTFTNPRQLDIDHMVPLKEAWRSGAYAWSDQKRENFANDLDWEYSLIAVSASSNRSKGDRDPADWLPPNTNFTCDYIYQWVTIKIRWELTIDDKEYNTIRNKTNTTCADWEIPQKSIPKP